MNEELIVSGRMNHHIDPVLEAWPWFVPADLFLAAMAAGILIISATITLFYSEEKYPVITRKATVVAPLALIIALLLLFLDLTHKLYVWRLYTTFRIESPMSWGSWTYLVITPLSIIWAGFYLADTYKMDNSLGKFIQNIVDFFKNYKRTIAWILLATGVILSVYTGTLLSAFNARPLWNTSVLPVLFLASGLTTGTALMLMLRPKGEERKLLVRLMVIFGVINTYLLVHMIMGFQSSHLAQQEAVQLFMGGEFTFEFWIVVVLLGLIIPTIMSIMELTGYKVPVFIPAVMVLIGGLVLRLVLVEAGQISQFVY